MDACAKPVHLSRPPHSGKHKMCKVTSYSILDELFTNGFAHAADFVCRMVSYPIGLVSAICWSSRKRLCAWWTKPTRLMSFTLILSRTLTPSTTDYLWRKLRIKDAPIGFPLSGFNAKAALHRRERLAFAVFTLKLSRWNADGTFVIIQEDQVSAFLHLLNTTLPGMKFPLEAQTNDILSFRDMFYSKVTEGGVRNIPFP